MKNLVRGGAILSVLALFVVFIYANTATTNPTESTLAIANDSQATIQNNIDFNLIDTDQAEAATDDVDPLVDPQTTQTQQTTGDKKLVKTTASTKAVVAAGASRGAFTATAYCFSGRTAMGHGVRRGLIAADPRVLRLGSRVTINAGAWSGTYLVSDTGGAIKGKRIDIWVPSCGEARRFGRRTVQIFSAQ